MNRRRLVVLGAGPAGLGAALGLAERGFDVDVVERRRVVGGNAGSFEVAGVRVDYGSHRLHPAADPAVLARLKGLLGDDLLERPRHGRIRLLGRWIHFPLRPLDLALRLPPRFAAGAALDVVRRLLGKAPAEETFASVLERGLGRTICRDFYFPYARKIWGMAPEEISPEQARKRVSAGSLGKLVRRLLPGGAGSGAAQTKGIFYYPRHGFGQISERLAEAATAAGARIALGSSVERVRRLDGDGFAVTVASEGGERQLEAGHVWSTIPSPVLAQRLEPAPPPDVLQAASSLELRAMLLVYLVLDVDRFSEYDAHYFPGADIVMTRLSEPKRYADRDRPRGRTVLCAEIPCSTSDPVWSMDDDELGRLVADGLTRAGLPLPVPIVETVSRRLPHAYPMYRRGFEAHLEKMESALASIAGLLSFGRQGLFAHDNTHHALYTASAAVECLGDDGSFDDDAWRRYRAIFATHVVED